MNNKTHADWPWWYKTRDRKTTSLLLEEINRISWTYESSNQSVMVVCPWDKRRLKVQDHSFLRLLVAWAWSQGVRYKDLFELSYQKITLYMYIKLLFLCIYSGYICWITLISLCVLSFYILNPLVKNFDCVIDWV